MSRIPRTGLVLLLTALISAATAASAAARPWPGDPVPNTLPPTEVIDQATTGTSPLWLFVLVAAATSLLVGAAAYFAGSRRRDAAKPGGVPSPQIREVALG